LLLFIMKGVTPAKNTMTDVYASAFPFVLITIFGIFLIYLFPYIAVWLPNIM